jgi:hypothetical protein
MRGVPQAAVSRLPSPALGRRWPLRLNRSTWGRRRPSTDRLETLHRLDRERRHALRTGTPSPELSRQWLRRL